MLVLCSTRSMASKEQLYEIDGFGFGLAVKLLVPVREAAALRLQSLDESARKASHSKVSTRCKIVLDHRLVTPSKTWIVFSPA